MTITPANDGPAIDLDATADGIAVVTHYTEGSPAILMAPNAIVVDADGATLGGGVLRIARVGNGGHAQDLLAIAHQGSGAGQIGVSGATISYGGTAIGTVGGGTGADPLVVSLNAAATPAAAQALLRAVTYFIRAPTRPIPSELCGDPEHGSGGPSATASMYALMHTIADPSRSISTGGGRQRKPVAYAAGRSRSGRAGRLAQRYGHADFSSFGSTP